MFKLSDFKKQKLSSEVLYQYSRSSGPGGQKVNKTETRAELFWSLLESQCFNEEQKQRLSDKLGNKMNKEGFVISASDTYRTREQNKNHCLEKLVQWIESALTKPKPRKKTKPTRASVEKRIKDKKRLSDKKKNRQKWD